MEDKTGADTNPLAHPAMAVIPESQRAAMLQAATAGLPLQPSDLAQLIQQESGWDTSAPNGGLGQIEPATAQNPGYGLAPVSPAQLAQDPAANLRFAAQYLVARGSTDAGLMTHDWSDPQKVNLALKAYNGGGDPNYVANVRGHAVGAGTGPGQINMSPSVLGVPLDGTTPRTSALGPFDPAALASPSPSPLSNPLVALNTAQGLSAQTQFKYTPVDYDPWKVASHV